MGIGKLKVFGPPSILFMALFSDIVFLETKWRPRRFAFSPDALLWSQRALAANKLNPVTHYTHAMILVELDRHADAARALASVLYLAPNHALAHYTLGVMAYRHRESAKARRYLDRARTILAQRPPGETVDEIDGLTNAELSEFVHRMHELLERQKDAA